MDEESIHVDEGRVSINEDRVCVDEDKVCLDEERNFVDVNNIFSMQMNTRFEANRQLGSKLIKLIKVIDSH
jgi:hypothetical protein